MKDKYILFISFIISFICGFFISRGYWEKKTINILQAMVDKYHTNLILSDKPYYSIDHNRMEIIYDRNEKYYEKPLIKNTDPNPILYTADVIPYCYGCLKEMPLKEMIYYPQLRIKRRSNVTMFYGATICSNCLKFIRTQE